MIYYLWQLEYTLSVTQTMACYFSNGITPFVFFFLLLIFSCFLSHSCRSSSLRRFSSSYMQGNTCTNSKTFSIGFQTVQHGVIWHGKKDKGVCVCLCVLFTSLSLSGKKLVSTSGFFPSFFFFTGKSVTKLFDNVSFHHVFTENCSSSVKLIIHMMSVTWQTAKQMRDVSPALT